MPLAPRRVWRYGTILDRKPLAKLPLRREPILGESLNGFIARLAEANRFNRVEWVANAARIRFPRIWYPDKQVESLAAVAGLEFDALKTIAASPPWQKGSTVVSTVHGHDISTDAFLRKGRRICPQCLTEASYHRMAWDMRFVRSCIHHLNRLVADCPACGRKLDWRTSSVRRCFCDFDLTTAPTVTVAAEVLAATRLLQSMLVDHDLELPVLLAGLDLDEVLFFLSKFGHFRGGGMEFLMDDTLDLSVEIWLTNGLAVLSQDVGDLERMLNLATQRTSAFPNRKTMALLATVHDRLVEIGPRATHLYQVVARILGDHPS